MWRFFYLRIWGFLSLASPLLATAQVTSPLLAKPNRIGDTISVYEREYFGLFNRSKDFAFATLSQDSRGGNVTIHYTNGQPTTNIVIDPAALRDLYDYTNNYEYYAKDAGPTFRPTRLVPLDLRLPLSRYERNSFEVELIDINGNSEPGEIFYVTDSAIAIWKLNLGYDWEFAQQNIKVFRFNEIQRINLEKRIPNLLIGAITGTAAGLLLAAIGNPVPVADEEIVSDAATVVGGFALGLLVGHIIEGNFPFRKVYRFNDLTNSAITPKSKPSKFLVELQSRAMFPGKVPPEFAP